MNNSVLAQTAVVIRAYKNGFIDKRVKFYLKMGFGRVIVVIKKDSDQGISAGAVRRFGDSRLQTIEMGAGYHWGTALNRATRSINKYNRTTKRVGLDRPEIKYVFNVSVEALFTADQVTELVNQIASDEKLGVVGTTFEGQLHGNPYTLGATYQHPRNTGMVIRLQALKDTLLFDTACDDMGGMEDFAFILEMLSLRDIDLVWGYKMLDLRVKLILGNNWIQDDKEVREQQAVQLIIADMRNSCAVASPELELLEQAITDMGF